MVAERSQDPIDMFLFVLRAPETKRQYMSRLRIFFDYIGLKGGIEEQAEQFVARRSPLAIAMTSTAVERSEISQLQKLQFLLTLGYRIFDSICYQTC